MRKLLGFGLLGLLIVTLSPGALAQQQTTARGLAYIDYYYDVQAEDEAQQGANGFEYRRVYLTVDHTLSDAFSTRVRFEANERTLSANRLPEPFIKDLYLRWRGIGAGHQLFFGVLSPPVFRVSEATWGYRSIERTILDRLRIDPSRDFGIQLRGPLVANNTLRYGVMVANNNSIRPENDRYKRVYGQLEWYPADPIRVTVGSDYARLQESGYTLSFNMHVGYVTDAMRLGFEGFTGQRQATENAVTDDRWGFSVYGVWQVAPQAAVFARFDHGDLQANLVNIRTDFVTLGVDYSLHEDVHVMPNVIYERQQDASGYDLSARLTLFFRY